MGVMMLASCKISKSASDKNAPSKKVSMNKPAGSEDMDTLSVMVNDSFNLSFYTNPSTGYFWEWVNSQNEHLDSVTHEFISEDNPHNYDGVGGVDKWSFKAKKKGFDSIVMIHHRMGDFENAFYQKQIIKIN